MKYRILLFTILISASLSCLAQICGCTDPLATNYNAEATVNDGSCSYDSVSVNPDIVGVLPDQLAGTSSLVYWNGNYWTACDHNSPYLYQLDTISGTITDSVLLVPECPRDLEEIAQDDDYFYLGDFGNIGDRTDLMILRIEKSALLSENMPTIDTIFFHYEDQTVFTSEAFSSDFDCEAFVVNGDSLYLFTKQWVSYGTKCYVLPKQPGNYVARLRGQYQIDGLVTGATLLEEQHLLVLCCYSLVLQPSVHLFYDYPLCDFFMGNKRKIHTPLMLSQAEAIATSDGLYYYLTNEDFSYELFHMPAKLMKMDLSEYLAEYLSPSTSNIENDDREILRAIRVYPNPCADKCFVEFENENFTMLRIYDSLGHLITEISPNGNLITLDLKSYPNGIYYIVLTDDAGKSCKRIIIKQR